MPPRRSTRSTAVASSSSTPVPVPAPAPAPAPATKPKAKATASRKRAAAAADDDEEDELNKKAPASKKSKKDTKADDVEMKDATSDAADDKDASKVDAKVDDDENIVTVLKRGAAPVDPTSGLVATHQVYVSGNDVWDAMLNQTNIQNNNNKFYVIQILHPIGNSNSCSVFTRWGRVGERGQSNMTSSMGAAGAIAFFKKTFKSKSTANWEDRTTMVARPGKYTWIERSFEEPKEITKSKDEEEIIIPDSKLDPALQTFCNMIFSTDLMNAALSSMNYDANKLPLGNLSKNTILRGFAALKELAEVLEAPAKAARYGGLKQACDTLSAQYYSIIPHAFGRNRPESINSKPKLKKELELMDALGDMEVAQEIIDADTHPKDANGDPINPLDLHFQSLDLKSMDPIASKSPEHQKLQEYVTGTHGFTHGGYNAEILQAFRVERHEEAARWTDAGHDKLAEGERLLLWHGSRSTNFAGILKQGLRIAPPEAPVTGYMFGKGVYFADAMSKSANYCHAYSSNNIGIMLLCEVAAKPFFEQTSFNYNAQVECAQAGKLATKGLGRTQPADWQDAGDNLGHDDLKGCWMPKGGLTNTDQQASLQYNEYIVYQPSQIKLRYLLMVKM